MIGVAVSLVMTAAILSTIFLPAIILAAVANYLVDIPRWIELFVALAVASVFGVIVAIWYTKALTTHSAPSTLEILKGFGLYFTLPICIYWHFTRNQPKKANKAEMATPRKPSD